MKNTKLFKFTLMAAAIATSVAATANDLVLEEIVVTAQKRVQSLQDVPIAVQAISADTLEQNTVVSISDLGNMSPGLSIGNSVQDGAEIAIRGIGTSVLGIGFDQSVPLYLDGVYLGRGFDLIGDLMDVQQVEVLKGPQGTLFGRNAAAGAINVTTRQPSQDTEGKIRIGAGSDDLKTVQAMYNTAISDDIFFRVNGSVRQRDGWQQNLDGGDDLYEQDQTTVRGKLLWDAADDLAVELTADYSNVDNTQGGYLIGKATPSIPTHDIDSESAPSTTLLLDGSLAKPYTKRSSSGYSAKVTWDMSHGLTLSSITSYRTADLEMQVGNGSLTVAVPFNNLPLLVDKFDIETDEYSQEFRLSGITEFADWFAGVNYYKSKASQIETLALPALAVAVGAPLQGTYGDDGQDSDVDTESYSVFGDVIWHLNDEFNLTAGLRYSYDEKTATFNSFPQRLGILFASVPGDFAGNPTQDSSDWDDVSGRVVVDYQLSDNAMIFAGISQGYKSGGYGTTTGPAVAASGNAFTPYDKETTTNCEGGIKSTLMEGRLRLNASVFYTEFENYQLQIADLEQPGTSLDLSAPQAESHGVDLEVAFVASESLNLNLSVGYLETEFSEDVRAEDDSIAIPEGQDLLRAPRWTTTAGLDYVINLSDIGDLRFNATYTYRTSQRLSNSPASSLTSATVLAAGDPGIVITESDNESGSYGLLNARLSLLSADETWELALWGTNLTDKAYRDDDNSAVANAVLGALSAQSGIPMAVTSYTRNEPRMWGVDVSYNF